MRYFFAMNLILVSCFFATDLFASSRTGVGNVEVRTVNVPYKQAFGAVIESLLDAACIITMADKAKGIVVGEKNLIHTYSKGDASSVMIMDSSIYYTLRLQLRPVGQHSTELRLSPEFKVNREASLQLVNMGSVVDQFWNYFDQNTGSFSK